MRKRKKERSKERVSESWEGQGYSHRERTMIESE